MENLIGKKFGRLTVIADMGRDNQRHQCWDCLCECGNLKAINGYSLLSGRTKSCGCINGERLNKRTSKPK